MDRRSWSWVIAVGVLVLVGCDRDDDTTVVASPPAVATDDPWANLVASSLNSSPGLDAIALAVHGDGIEEAVAAGTDEDGAVTAERPLRIASNTKTFVAAATLRLVEDGRLALGDTVAEQVDPELVTLLEGDGYEPASITIDQLLTHTSGIADYAADVDFQVVVLGDPDAPWTRLEQVRWAVEHADPLGAPGAIFGYSDTGYVLLGDVIERVTGSELGPAVRDLLRFGELGLDATYWEVDEQPPAGQPPRAHQFYESQDMTDADPSFDRFGGGGLVSTVGDLARFYTALLDGAVFDDPATLATMTAIPSAAADAGAAMGLFRFDDPQLGTCWNHSGFWGTIVIACPDLTVAVSVFQASPDPPFDGDALLRDAFDLAAG